VRLRGLSLVVLSIALAAQAVPSPVAAAAVRGAPPSATPSAAPTLPSPGGGGKNGVPGPRVVDVRTISKRARTPTLPSPASGGGKLLSLFPRQGGGRSASLAGTHAVEMASAFEGLSLAQNDQLYGPDQDVEPADAQIAASPSALVHLAGNTMALFGSNGSLQ